MLRRIGVFNSFRLGMEVAEEAEVTLEKGKTLLIQLLAVGKLNARGEREVFFNLNGQMRTIIVPDKEASKVFSFYS